MPVYRPKDSDGLFTKDETIVLGSCEELFQLSSSFKKLTKVILINPNSEKYNAQKITNQLANIHIDAVYTDTDKLHMIEAMLNNK